MKNASIAALIGLNVILALVMVFDAPRQTAQAQAFRGQSDYIVCTGAVDQNTEVVYVLDLAKRRLVAFEPDPNNKFRLKSYRGRKLADDFEYPKP